MNCFSALLKLLCCERQSNGEEARTLYLRIFFFGLRNGFICCSWVSDSRLGRRVSIRDVEKYNGLFSRGERTPRCIRHIATEESFSLELNYLAFFYSL